MGEAPSLEEKIGGLEFIHLQGYLVTKMSRCKKKDQIL